MLRGCTWKQEADLREGFGTYEELHVGLGTFRQRRINQFVGRGILFPVSVPDGHPPLYQLTEAGKALLRNINRRHR